MKRFKLASRKFTWIVFFTIFALCVGIGLASGLADTAQAAPAPQTTPQATGYVGSTTCSGCHETVHDTWAGTRHSQAFTSPVFQQDWATQGSSVECLKCHTTGYDPVSGKYAEEGVACEACHGPFQEGHPENPMPITPDASLCADCHKTTTDEWHASKHGEVGINCEDCHNSHSQEPRAESVNELCTNCHKDTGSSFTHGTHANSGLQCSDCHMATAARTSMTGGLVGTGHTFTVGSEACINCHKDTVHTRDTIVKLSGETSGQAEMTIEELQKKAQEDTQTIENLRTQSSVRLYTGLIQGAIVGLIIGGVTAWIVSRRIRIVEVDEDGQ